MVTHVCIRIVRRSVLLEDCMYGFCTTEDLTGSDKYKCEHCKQLNDGQKTFSILETPEVLCIHLKRFRYDSFFSGKLSDHVVFPLTGFDVSPFCEMEGKKDAKDTVYDLLAVINHRGGLGGGHYVAYCKNALTGKWYEFDDRSVVEVSEDAVKEVEAYVLFYQKRIPPSRTQEINTIKHLVRSKQGVEPQYLIPRAWYAKFCSTSNPGPINTSPYLCRHGYLKTEHLRNLYQFVSIPESAWKALSMYGRGFPIQQKSCEMCEKENEELQIRREAEKNAIQQRDRTYLLPGESWYIISSKWLQEWHKFIEGSPTVPGKISNEEDLLDDDGMPKKGLQRSVDYRGVTREVWKYFQETYGGVEIVRNSIDIYDIPQNGTTDKH